MSRRRSVSLSSSPFLPVIDREEFIGTGHSTLAALSLPSLGIDDPDPLSPASSLVMEDPQISVTVTETITAFPTTRLPTFRPIVKKGGNRPNDIRPPMPQRSSTLMDPKLASWGDAGHPFDSSGFLRGLLAGGYLETLDVSRKKIKSRFMHALNKEQFQIHLEQFLVAKALKKRGEFMVRFLGEQDVHSPFVHVYVTTLPEDTTLIKIRPEEITGKDEDKFTLWTYLRTIKGASHWSCKAKGFWPLRVVLQGDGDPNANTQLNKAATTEQNTALNERPSNSLRIDDFPDELDDDRSRSSRSRDRSRDRPRTVDLVEDGSIVTVTDDDPVSGRSSELPPIETPTIVESIKQLGQSIIKDLPPSVQTSFEKFPETVSTGFGTLRNRFAAWATPKVNELETEEKEREERRQERRARRAERKAVEDAEREAEEEMLSSLARKQRRASRKASLF